MDNANLCLLSLMIGPSGAGKSHWLASDAAKSYGIRPSHILSSDEIRIDIAGSLFDQSKNDRVFQSLDRLIYARIGCGLPVVVDATNLYSGNRVAMIRKVETIYSGPVRYLIINRPMAEKRRDGGWRNTLDFDLLAKHEAQFNDGLDMALRGDRLRNVIVHDLRTF